MAKQKNKIEDWQQYFEQLDNDTSPNTHFIRQYKTPGVKRYFEIDHDYFSSPMVDQVFNETGEGQLSLDVFQTENELMIKATIAGVDPKNLDISLDNDVLTIRGERKDEDKKETAEYYYQECYWGKFSRSIVLPSPVNADKVKASIKNGILTITLPRLKSNKSINIQVKEID